MGNTDAKQLSGSDVHFNVLEPDEPIYQPADILAWNKLLGKCVRLEVVKARGSHDGAVDRKLVCIIRDYSNPTFLILVKGGRYVLTRKGGYRCIKHDGILTSVAISNTPESIVELKVELVVGGTKLFLHCPKEPIYFDLVQYRSDLESICNVPDALN